MRATDVPLTNSELWDAVAKRVKRGAGKWVLVHEGERDRIEKTKASLALRGLKVEVTSRTGNESKGRPWNGVRTFARVVS